MVESAPATPVGKPSASRTPVLPGHYLREESMDPVEAPTQREHRHTQNEDQGRRLRPRHSIWAVDYGGCVGTRGAEGGGGRHDARVEGFEVIHMQTSQYASQTRRYALQRIKNSRADEADERRTNSTDASFWYGDGNAMTCLAVIAQTARGCEWSGVGASERGAGAGGRVLAAGCQGGQVLLWGATGIHRLVRSCSFALRCAEQEYPAVPD